MNDEQVGSEPEETEPAAVSAISISPDGTELAAELPEVDLSLGCEAHHHFSRANGAADAPSGLQLHVLGSFFGFFQSFFSM